MAPGPQALTGLAAIVLAAGAGQRMGGPKAVLLVEGEPLALLHVRRARQAECNPVVLVTRAELAARFAGHDCTVAISGAPDPAGSLAVGLSALTPAPDDLVVITPVDAWPVRLETFARLVAAVRGGAEAATPVSGGRGGHPVVVRARVLAGASFLDAPRPLRDVLADLGPRRVRLEVDDPSIAIDLDSPDDVARLTGAPARFS